MYTDIVDRCNALAANFSEISEQRKMLLDKLSLHIRDKYLKKIQVQLVYICTHNSRRSHFGQVWAAVAAHYYNIENVTTFSGGTESTAFHPNAIAALEDSGFNVQKMEDFKSNPVYAVHFDNENFINCFSKTFDNIENPTTNFIAVMTCSDADENCPFIPGCDLRISTTYNDPKSYDDTVIQDEKYLERSNQIAMECLYVFSKIKSQVYE